MFSISYRPTLDWAQATHAKYSGKEAVVQLVQLTFSHSLKLHLDVQGMVRVVEKAVRECVVGERLVPCAREYFDYKDELCSGGVVEQEDSYIIPLVYTNEVYASVIVSLLQQEVERRWLEMFLGRGGLPHHFRRVGNDLQVYSRSERVATIHICAEDMVLEWRKSVALQDAERAALPGAASFVLDEQHFCIEQFGAYTSN